MHRRDAARLAAVALCSLLSSPTRGADLTGTWIGTIPKQGRAPATDLAFRFAQRGPELTGKAYNAYGTSDEISEGTVSNGSIQFVVQAMEQAGNQINLVVYRFDGTVGESGIALTRELAGIRDAASGAVVPVRRAWDSDEEDRKRRFKAVRLERLFQ